MRNANARNDVAERRDGGRGNERAVTEEHKVGTYLFANKLQFPVRVLAARAADTEEVAVRDVPIAHAEDIMAKPGQSVVQLIGNREKTFPVPFHGEVRNVDNSHAARLLR